MIHDPFAVDHNHCEMTNVKNKQTRHECLPHPLDGITQSHNTGMDIEWMETNGVLWQIPIVLVDVISGFNYNGR